MYSWYPTCCVLQVHILIYKQKMVTNLIMHPLKAGTMRAGPHIIWTSDGSLFYNKLITDIEVCFHFNWKKSYFITGEHFQCSTISWKARPCLFSLKACFSMSILSFLHTIQTIYWYINEGKKRKIIICFLSFKNKKIQVPRHVEKRNNGHCQIILSFWSPNTCSEWK